MFYVDSREPDYLLRRLSGTSLKFDVKSLPAGDFLIDDLLIERKTVNDFLNSVSKNRFFPQLNKLKEVCKENSFQPILLLEGDLKKELFYRNWKPTQVLGVLSSVLVDFKIPVFMLPSEDWTVMWILNLAKQKVGEARKGYSLRVPPTKEMSVYDKALYLLEGFELVGPVTSRKLLNIFGSIKNLVDNVYQLEKFGVSKRLAQEIRDVLLYHVKK